MRISSSVVACYSCFRPLEWLLARTRTFATGPQYLMNSDPTNLASPLFARPISTPSLSLTGPPLESRCGQRH